MVANSIMKEPKVFDVSGILYPNFRNFLHEVPKSTPVVEEQYILFNPTIHYWIALNETGAEIVRAIGNGVSIKEIYEKLLPKEVASNHMEQSIQGFLNKLIELNFFKWKKTPQHLSWVPQEYQLDTIEKYPFHEIIISLSDNCNLECSYCFNHSERATRLELGKSLRRIGPLDVRRILEEFREMGGRSVLLTGGEPTLNPHFLDICEEAKNLGFNVNVITNGTRLSSLNTARLVESVNTLAVSLDSLDDAVNAQLWNVSKYEARRDILLPLGNIGRSINSQGKQIQIVIKPTVTRRNLRELDALMKNISEILSGCSVSFDISKYENIGHEPTDKDLRIGEDDLENELTNIAHSILPKELNAEACYARDIAAEAFGLSCGNKLDGLELPKIMSCVPSLFVTNSGDVYPCQSMEVEEFWLGNVFEQTLQSTFESEGINRLRKVMTRDDVEVCRDCEFRYMCMDHCHGCSFKKSGRTTAFAKSDDLACRSKMIRRLWLETQKRENMAYVQQG